MFEQHNKNIVRIEFIANGVIVHLPIRKITTEEYEKSLVLREAKLEKMYREETESDSEIRRLQGTVPEEIPVNKQYRKMTVSEISDELIYQFKTLPEALEFIQNEFKN